MALAPNGDVFVADPGVNSIFILRDTNGDGVAETRFTFASNLNLPFGMAFWRDYFYVANTRRHRALSLQSGSDESRRRGGKDSGTARQRLSRALDAQHHLQP